MRQERNIHRVVICQGGFYSDSTACMPCPYDFFSENQSSTCSACPSDSTGPGQTVAYGCACDPGFYPFRKRSAGGVESVLGATFKQHVFAGGAGVFVLSISRPSSRVTATPVISGNTRGPRARTNSTTPAPSSPSATRSAARSTLASARPTSRGYI